MIGLPAPGPARARRRDRVPSHAAADRMNASGRGAAQEQQILALLADGLPRTAHEIARQIGLDSVAVTRRLSDNAGGLVGRNLVERKRPAPCACGCGQLLTLWRKT